MSHTLASLTPIQKIATSGEVHSQVFDKTPFLDFLEARGRVMNPGVGSPVTILLNTAGNANVGLETENTDISTWGNQTYLQAVVPAFTVIAPVQISGLAEDNARKNLYYGGNLDNGELMVRSARDVRRAIEARLLSTNVNQGLQSLVTNGVYGAVSGSVVTSWASPTVAATGSLTLADMREAQQKLFSLSEGIGEGADVILMNSTTYNSYVSYGSVDQTPLQRAVNPVKEGNFDLGVPGNGVFGGVTFDGIPILITPDLPDTSVIFFNSKYFTLHVNAALEAIPMGKTSRSDKWLVAMGVVPEMTVRKAFCQIIITP